MSEVKDAAANISLLAGRAATAAMLLDVPRLVTAYYSEVPDASVPIFYLFQHRPKYRRDAVGKTVVSSSMIDRVAAKLNRKLYEVPVEFKWFVEGLLDGSLGFGGEESAGASFTRLNGTVWTTDKDGIVPAMLAAEITVRMGRDPGDIYRDLTGDLGNPDIYKIYAESFRGVDQLRRILEEAQVMVHATLAVSAPGDR